MTADRYSFSQQKLIAVLGPTNTGKTHLAIERLCAHSSGLIGFPLRLLAREVYDRVCAIKGPKEVALITGEERIVPDGARWVLATMESMPVDGDYAFVAIDEAQLGADPERGHIFTQRILHARGREETMILGSASLRPMITALLPEAEIVTRPRFSTLSYGGHKKLSRLPPRSAIVAFSAEEVYATAELLRRFRGGAAVVMGALSPRTRNAQVAMFQAGEVDYLVATDAIGMGLNLDVHHVAFSALRKFDGHRRRRLTIAEMAQIAGRAGRHQRDGSFGTLASLSGGKSAEFTPEEIERIENHQVPPLSHLYWRQHDLDYASIDALTASLHEKPGENYLRPAPEALDMAILQRLAGDSQIADSARSSQRVARLWAACSLPDFRQLGADHHARFVAQLWNYLKDGTIPHDYASRKLDEIDNAKGDVGTLSGRLAAIRNWAYIAERPDWLDGRFALGERARDIEEKLSDALHSALAERFVDRRASVLMRRLKQDSALLPVTIDDDDIVSVDGEAIGRLEGFHFHVGPDARLADRKMLLAAAERHIGALLAVRAKALIDDEDKAFSLSDTILGGICWQDILVARWQRGGKVLAPALALERSLDALDAANRDAVLARLVAWCAAMQERDLKTLNALQLLSENPDASPTMRAVATQLLESGGVTARSPALHELLGSLTADERQALRSANVRIGALDLFIPSLYNQRTRSWIRHLLAIWYKKSALPDDPMKALPAMLTIQPEAQANDNDAQTGEGPDNQEASHHNQGHERHLGYRRAGNSWLRVDMAERLLRAAHDARQSGDGEGKNADKAKQPEQAKQTASDDAAKADEPAKPAKPDKPPKAPKSGRADKPLFALSDHLALSIGLTRDDWEKLLRTGGFRKAAPHEVAAAAKAEQQVQAKEAETKAARATTTTTKTTSATEAQSDAPAAENKPAKAPEAEAPKSAAENANGRPILRQADKPAADDTPQITPNSEDVVPEDSAGEDPAPEETVLWRWVGLNKQRRRRPEHGRQRRDAHKKGRGDKDVRAKGRSGDNPRGPHKPGGQNTGRGSGGNQAGNQSGNQGGSARGRSFSAARATPVHPEFEKLRALFPQGAGSADKPAKKKPRKRPRGKKKDAQAAPKTNGPNISGPNISGDGGAAG